MSLIELTPEKKYSILTKVAAIAGAIGTRQLIKSGWKGVTKNDPPKDPSSSSVLWKEAIMWGAVTGLTVGVMKVVSRRLTGAFWEKNIGPKPKGA